MFSWPGQAAAVTLLAGQDQTTPVSNTISSLANTVTPVTQTVQGAAAGTLGSVSNTVSSLGSGTITLPSTPPVDVGSTLDQTVQDVNGLGLPLQLPQPGITLTVPGINPNQLTGGGISLPGSTGSSPPGGGTLPGPPGDGSAGGTDHSSAPSLISAPGTDAGGGQAGAISAQGENRDAAAAGEGSGPRLSPAGVSGSIFGLDPATAGLALLPLIGAMCLFLALSVYMKSARNIWNART